MANANEKFPSCIVDLGRKFPPKTGTKGMCSLFDSYFLKQNLTTHIIHIILKKKTVSFLGNALGCQGRVLPFFKRDELGHVPDDVMNVNRKRYLNQIDV